MKRLRLLLLPFSAIFRLIVGMRNLFFDFGLLKISKAGAPVISVGNILTGGTGKTPIVEMLIERFQGSRRVGVVSRGYGRKTRNTVVVSDGTGVKVRSEEAGDEPSQIACKYRGLIVVVDEKKARGAKKAVELGAEVVLLDDGFQHRYLYRDLDIAVVTAEEILKGEWLLPAGNRREPLSSLKRSDLILISRCRDKMRFEIACKRLEKYNKPVIGMCTCLKSFRSTLTEERTGAADIRGKKVIAFSGIGDPGSFSELLTGTGAVVVKNLVFPDHHWYSAEEVKRISAAGRESGAEFIVTTEKDAARLKDLFSVFPAGDKVIVAEIFQEFISGSEKLDGILSNVFKQKM
jgi:tetraacyldisaccharide 4'-kinase